MEQESIHQIFLKELVPAADNPRGEPAPESIAELRDSIKAKGIIQPLLVRSRGAKGFEIIAGYRRYMAAKLAGFEYVPCRVLTVSDDEAQELRIVENLQREDIHPMEEAQAYAALKRPVADVAAKVGKSIAYVTQRIHLLKLIGPAQKAFRAGHFTIDHAIQIARLRTDDQERALAYVMEMWDEQAFYPGSDDEQQAKVIQRIARSTSGEKMRDLDRPVCTVQELSNFIQSAVHLNLRDAAFDKKDATLLKESGSCTECPRRTGFNRDLFSDIEQADTCTDPACYHKKEHAHVQRIIDRLKAEKKPYVLITTQPRKPKGFPTAITWRSFRELQGTPCAHAITGISVDTPIGKLKTVCADKECKKHWPPQSQSAHHTAPKEDPKKQEEQKLKEQINDEVTKAIEKLVLDAVVAKADATLRPVDLNRVWEAIKKDSWTSRSAQKVVKNAPITKKIKLDAIFSVIDDCWDVHDLHALFDQIGKEYGLDVPAKRKALTEEITAKLSPKHKTPAAPPVKNDVKPAVKKSAKAKAAPKAKKKAKKSKK